MLTKLNRYGADLRVGIEDEVAAQASAQVTHRVMEHVWDQIWDQIWHQVGNQVINSPGTGVFRCLLD